MRPLDPRLLPHLTPARAPLTVALVTGVVSGLLTVAPGGGTGKIGAAVVLALAAILGGAVYSGLVWLLRVVGLDEVGLLRRALRRG